MTQKHIRPYAGWAPRVWAQIYYPPQVLTLLMVIAYVVLLVGWTTALTSLPLIL